MIQPTAIIHKTANIDPSVEIANYVVIEENVIIKKGTKIGPHTVIANAIIGENCDISHSVSIGAPPQDLKYKGQKTIAIVGDNCTIREFSTIHRASALEATRVGNNCYLMAYSHVGHDSAVGEGVCMANCASLGGHVTVEDYAVLGALSGVHQHTRIGKYAMMGGGAIATRDVLPYALSSGDRARIYGLNYVGLKRSGMPAEAIKSIKHAYHILFATNKSISKALKDLEKEHKQKNMGNETDHIINFIKTSKRGISSPAHRRGTRYEDSD